MLLQKEYADCPPVHTDTYPVYLLLSAIESAVYEKITIKVWMMKLFAVTLHHKN